MNDNLEFITLDNGLTVLIYSDKTKMSNHVELTTFIGGLTSIYEDENGKTRKIKPGTAHLLEHYICENAKKGNLIDNLHEYKVLNANAVTAAEKTKMFFDTVYNLNECLELFLDSMYNIDFTSEKLEKTKYAVYNEIRDSKDNLGRKIYRAKIKNIFENIRDTLGTKTSINSIGYKYLEAVYKNFYVPKNQLLVVAGSFDEEDILNQIKAFYNNYEFKNNKKAPRLIDSSDKIKRKESEIEGEDLNEIIISYKIKDNDMTNFERYKLDWYLNYFKEINLSKYSLLNETLKKENIIAGDLSSHVYDMNGYKILEVLAYTDNKEKFIKLVKDTIDNFNNTKEELELRKKANILHISVRKDRISNHVLPIIDNYLEFDYPYNDTIEFVESLNYEEYLETINNINFDNYSILTVKGSNQK